MQSSSSSGSTKRTRAPVMGIQSVACLVDGCTADLSKCRDYHRRHKVCEPHSKTRMVTIGGYERRFCQQCSRFHSLVEFDEGKRSCRKRLDGHNRRRRKPQPETFSISSGGFLSAHQGTKYLNFGGPQMFPTSSTRNSDWGDPAKANDHSVFYNSHSSTGLYTHSYGGGNQQFPFLQAELSYSEASSVVQPLLKPKCASRNGRAHSLLSSSSLAETGETGLSSCIHQPQQQPFMADLNYQQQRSVLASDTNLSCQDMFQIGPSGPSSVEPHHRLSFSWD